MSQLKLSRKYVGVQLQSDLQKTHRDGALPNTKKGKSSIPTVPDIDITAPIDNDHIGANSPPISVTGLMSYLQVSLRLANSQKF